MKSRWHKSCSCNVLFGSYLYISRLCDASILIYFFNSYSPYFVFDADLLQCPSLIVQYRAAVGAKNSLRSVHIFGVCVKCYVELHRELFLGFCFSALLLLLLFLLHYRIWAMCMVRNYQSNFNIGYELTWKIWLFCALLTLGGIFFLSLFFIIIYLFQSGKARKTERYKQQTKCKEYARTRQKRSINKTNLYVVYIHCMVR